ncbi:hypothetical protein J2Z62_000180 [Mycoplasmoides fastidiosum]|uniref:DUF4258 domain-containing protein n=1 Tax=Mycoplasmoides fastidiosum TaxID=92758 RepID=A0ABU0LYG2_9BACT|nr:hypothetical protein [Mycoplasmoides fastidiosum]MDQ0513742.1 hypothetical protein [Mycoplasmoides fastidiosum]UUD37837.1 hypothetical protein NPA10_00360 [Mycoplasmoides fastidiosum]
MSYYATGKIKIAKHAVVRAKERIPGLKKLSDLECDIKINQIANEAYESRNIFIFSNPDESKIYYLIDSSYWVNNKPICMVFKKSENLVVSFIYAKN